MIYLPRSHGASTINYYVHLQLIEAKTDVTIIKLIGFDL
jgi:hypothetical protein